MVGVALSACPTEAVSWLLLYFLGEGFKKKCEFSFGRNRSALVCSALQNDLLHEMIVSQQ